ncbi:MAG: gliding motility protein RemB [Flavobacteriaceae bacterium]|nr:gliding motility protein RemB [Flavobacteriaceae bacterium]
MKKLVILFTLFQYNIIFSQNEKPPVYLGCEKETIEDMESCFFIKIKEAFKKDFQLPTIVTQENYKGVLRIVFNVTKTGELEVLYINAVYTELENEAKRIFKTLPKIKPATYNGRAIEKQYILPLGIPIGYKPIILMADTINDKKDLKKDIQKVVIKNTYFPEHESQLNIPFTHQKYDALQFGFNQGENTHSAVKPYTYNAVSKHTDITTKKQKLFKKTNVWFTKKLWNEHLVNIKGDDYWFTLNPVFDVQIGKDNSNLDYTFNNTRAINVQGGLGKKFNFSASIYESQGRFAGYINDFNNENDIVLGRGRFKRFKENAFDYPVAEGYLSYTPNHFFNFQLGHGKNFIGDGYRSLFLSDVASPYPYFKITTKFWKIKYTNLWMFLDDIRPEAQVDGVNLRKYVGIHHFSYNVTKKLNIGLFETVVTNNENNKGFDINYFNPIIFYRAVEFNQGSRGGNALIGLNASYKWNKKLFLYTQFLLDELSIDKLKEGNGYWANKFGVQLGFKYHNAFGIENLYLQGETNIVKPFTYSHRESTLNYGNFNQPLAHFWGSNFYELIGIIRYSKNRWFGNAKLVYGKKGFDIENDEVSYGGDIYRAYTERVSDFGNEIAQGNKTTIFNGEFQAGYLVNPTTNLQLFAGFTYRDFTPQTNTTNFSNQNTTWFTFGLKTDLFNSYFDF